MEAQRAGGLDVFRLVVDEHRLGRRQAMGGEKKFVDVGVRLDQADLARDDDGAEPIEEVEAGAGVGKCFSRPD